jgi:hypothetical protein
MNTTSVNTGVGPSPFFNQCDDLMRYIQAKQEEA